MTSWPVAERCERSWCAGRLVLSGAVLVSVLAFTACNEPPVLRALDTRETTDIEAGPYEVRAVAHSPDGFGSSHLLVAGDDRAGTNDANDADDVESRAFDVDDDSPGQFEAAFIGRLPGRPLGSVIRFAVEICDAEGLCLLDPARFPEDAHELVVGRVPSSPSIRLVRPDRGPDSGGTVVEIDGAGFRDGVEVRFGGVVAPHLERLTTTLLRVITPPLQRSDDDDDDVSVDVDVTNADGATFRFDDAFTYTPAPRLSSVVPDVGPTAGGTSLTLAGRGFTTSDRVLVDGVPCRGLVFTSSSSLACTTPPGRAGLVDIAVVAEDGGQGVLPASFRYRPPPRVDSVSPDQGNSEGGTLITIVGDDFDASTGGDEDSLAVFVGDVPCLDVVLVDANTITCLTSNGPPGVADIVVVNGDNQEGRLLGGFNRLGPPLLLEIVPDRAPYGGGVEVRLLGAGLSADDRVSFVVEVDGVANSVEADVLDAVDDLELLVLVPTAPVPLEPAPVAGFRLASVQVERQLPEDDRSTRLDNRFRYLWPPEVQVVVPGSGPTSGGSRVVVVGRFFTDDTLITFDGNSCLDQTVVSSTEILCTTPPGEAGPADVQAFVDDTDPVGGVVAVGAFTYVPPPVVVRIAPAEGPTFGGDAVTVTGTGFQNGATIRIDGAACTPVVFVSATELRCVTPPGDRGQADVSVENPDGQADTGERLYTYVGLAVIPNHGLPVGFTNVRIRAAGIREGVVFRFGAVVASCVRISDREARCQTPAQRQGVVGPIEVRFTNPDGTSDGEEAFTYTEYHQTQGRLQSNAFNSNHVVLVDVDNDNDLDAVVANGRVGQAEPSEVYVNTAGTFERREIPGVVATANKVDVGRINNDAFPDLVFGASDVGAVLLQSTGPAQWSRVDLPLGPEESAFDAQLADLVGDDRDDLLVLGIGCDLIIDFNTNPGCDPVRFGRDALFEQTGQNGGSRLTRRDNLIPHEQRQAHDHKMAIFDLDGDSDNDILIVVNNEAYTSAQNRVLRNRSAQGQGFVKEVGAVTGLIGDLYDIHTGDIDGDGDDDVVTSLCLGDGDASSEVVLRNDNGTLVHDESALPGFFTSCAIGTQLIDVDSDGDLDIFWTGTRDVRFDHRTLLRLYINRGDGSFVDASAHLPRFNQDLQGNNAAGGDVDGDGDLDLIIAGGAPYLNTGLPGRVLFFEQR